MTTKQVTITKEQFEKYLKVQNSGRFNMFDPRARQAAGLDKEQFMAIISNYNELTKQFEGCEGSR